MKFLYAKEQIFFLLPFFFACIALLCFFHICLSVFSFHSSNPHKFFQWQQALSGMALPFLNTKDKDLLKKKTHVDRACLAPVLVNQLCVLAVTFPNREVEEKRVHRSSLFSLGQFGSALAKCKHGDFTFCSTFSFMSVCRPQVNVSWQTLFSLDIDHLKWKNVPCLFC